MAATGTTELEAMVKRARETYVFRHRENDPRSDLIRVGKGKGCKRIDELVDGRWLATSRCWSDAEAEDWKPVKEEDLVTRARRFHLENLDAEPVVLKPTAGFSRLGSSRIGRWVNPPLQGGARRHLKTGEVVNRCRSSFVQDLAHVTGEDLLEIKAQITSGYEGNLGRISRAEQRANIFLGASVLTSSLVLGNAGLLLGTKGRLEAPFLQIGAAALALASACALLASYCALQASLSTFGRVTPTKAKDVFVRRELHGEDLTRSYVAALFVATDRTATIADWKVDRMKAARNWILATAAAVVALTIIVLIDAV